MPKGLRNTVIVILSTIPLIGHASAASAQALDGRWEGTYRCGAHAAKPLPAFSWPVTAEIKNGSISARYNYTTRLPTMSATVFFSGTIDQRGAARITAVARKADQTEDFHQILVGAAVSPTGLNLAGPMLGYGNTPLRNCELTLSLVEPVQPPVARAARAPAVPPPPPRQLSRTIPSLAVPTLEAAPPPEPTATAPPTQVAVTPSPQEPTSSSTPSTAPATKITSQQPPSAAKEASPQQSPVSAPSSSNVGGWVFVGGIGVLLLWALFRRRNLAPSGSVAPPTRKASASAIPGSSKVGGALAIIIIFVIGVIAIGRNTSTTTPTNSPNNAYRNSLTFREFQQLPDGSYFNVSVPTFKHVNGVFTKSRLYNHRLELWVDTALKGTKPYELGKGLGVIGDGTNESFAGRADGQGETFDFDTLNPCSPLRQRPELVNGYETVGLEKIYVEQTQTICLEDNRLVVRHTIYLEFLDTDGSVLDLAAGMRKKGTCIPGKKGGCINIGENGVPTNNVTDTWTVIPTNPTSLETFKNREKAERYNDMMNQQRAQTQQNIECMHRAMNALQTETANDPKGFVDSGVDADTFIGRVYQACMGQ
jgi:hypothetical protein